MVIVFLLYLLTIMLMSELCTGTYADGLMDCRLPSAGILFYLFREKFVSKEVTAPCFGVRLQAKQATSKKKFACGC
jgi:hypothetical protein